MCTHCLLHTEQNKNAINMVHNNVFQIYFKQHIIVLLIYMGHTERNAEFLTFHSKCFLFSLLRCGCFHLSSLN